MPQRKVRLTAGHVILQLSYCHLRDLGVLHIMLLDLMNWIDSAESYLLCWAKEKGSNVRQINIEIYVFPKSIMLSHYWVSSEIQYCTSNRRRSGISWRFLTSPDTILKNYCNFENWHDFLLRVKHVRISSFPLLISSAPDDSWMHAYKTAKRQKVLKMTSRHHEITVFRAYQ